MHPRVLTDLGLVPALQWLARGVRRRHDVQLAVTAPTPAPHLRPVIAATLFSVARETLDRAAGRDGARSITIALSVEERGAQLVIQDDGRVASSAEAAELEAVLRQRVGLVDGWVSIEKPARGGNVIIVIVPLEL